MARRGTSSLLGAVYLLIGAALLGSALFAPWYYYDGQLGKYSGPDGTVLAVRDLNFLLIPLLGSGPVRGSCPSGSVPNLCPISYSYSNAGFSSTGWVAAVTFGLATAGFVAGAFAGILGVVWGRKPRREFLELILAVVAIALAIAATAAFAVFLPGAFAHDIPASQRSFAPSGPWSSFYGSATYIIPLPCPPPGCPPTIASWGPGIGWALSVAAIMVLLVGAVMMIRFRHDFGDSAPSAASAELTQGPNTPKSTP